MPRKILRDNKAGNAAMHCIKETAMVKMLAALLLLSAIFGCAEKFDHDTELAAKRALEFADATFVRRNLEKGYALLADKARSYVPPDIFADKVTKMHPSGYPGKVTAAGAVPVKGEKIVQVRVRGESSGARYEYAVTLTGTAATDYRVTLFSGGRTS
jgi:hypothetical protein